MQGLSHNSIHPSDFFQHFQCQIHYDTGTFVVGILNFQSNTASLPLVYHHLRDDILVGPGTDI